MKIEKQGIPKETKYACEHIHTYIYRSIFAHIVVFIYI